MKTLLVIFSVLIALAGAQDAEDEVDSCYHCYSSTSWTDCYDQEYREDCRDYCNSRGIICDRCYKYHDVTNNIFRKGCAPKVDCDSNYAWRELCQSPECMVWCCDGDNCNGSATISISLGLAVTTVLVTLLNLLA